MNDAKNSDGPLNRKLRMAESALADLEERCNHLVTGSHGLICTHDMDGVLLSINPTACEMLEILVDSP